MHIKKLGYGYGKAAKEQSGWCLAEAMLRVSDFPFMNLLESNDHILSHEEVLNSKMDEDIMFRDLDKAGHICSLAPPMSLPMSDLLVVLPQNLLGPI